MDNGKKKLGWEMLCNKTYEYIEDSLIEINFFRRYKDNVCLMSDDECIDLYKGVVLFYHSANKKGYEGYIPKNLFETIYDYYRLRFATQRIVWLSFRINSSNEKESVMTRIIKNRPVNYDMITTSVLSFMIKYCM